MGARGGRWGGGGNPDMGGAGFFIFLLENCFLKLQKFYIHELEFLMLHEQFSI